MKLKLIQKNFHDKTTYMFIIDYFITGNKLLLIQLNKGLMNLQLKEITSHEDETITKRLHEVVGGTF